MPLNMDIAASNGVINASDIESNVSKTETYLNGGIESSDYLENWVESTHIRPPQFYGAPAPRTELVSSDVHTRKVGIENVDYFRLWKDVSKDSYLPVSGLATTVHVSPAESGSVVPATVLCNFYTREMSFGKDTLAVNNEAQIGLNVFAEFNLFVQRDDSPPILQQGTRRLLHAAGDLRIAAQNFSIATKVDLQTGINHIYVGVKIVSTCPDDKAYRLLVGSRSLICDVHYL